MKVLVMMRVLDQETGLSFFTDALLRALFELGSVFDLGDSLSFVLLYMTAKHFGRYVGVKNVKEILVRSSQKLFWDQVVVPWVAWREGADVIFNPKFSVPLISHCPVAMGLQEPAWWAIPEHHTGCDVLYMRSMLPLYCRKASHLFPWSQFNLNETRRYLGLLLEQATVTPFAPDAAFNRRHDPATLDDFRRSEGLPAQFILTVTRVLNLGNKAAAFTGTKNVETTLRAFCQIRDRIPHELVIVGRRVREYLEYVGWKDFERIRFAAFPREAMPKVYQCSELCVLPSFYEGCPTTLIEAMASGCATVTSKTSAFPEIAAGAALLADPHDPSDFGAKMLQVLTNPELGSELRRKSLRRAKIFCWERTARLTFEGLQGVLSRRAKAKGTRSQKGEAVATLLDDRAL